MSSFEPVLDLRGVRASYGTIEVLHGVDLAIRPGEVMAVLGPNGAGKTTMLAVLAGLHPLAGGDMYLAGRRVNGAQPEDLARAGLCLVPEGRGVFPNLTVRENLWMMSFSRRSLRDIEETTYERFPRLKDKHGQMAGTLSGGEQQMLAIARALMAKPRLLLLDEPSLGLAPMLVNRIFSVISRLKETGVTILLVEQNARKALEIADRAYVMETGRVILEGDARELAANPEIEKAYLGG